MKLMLSFDWGIVIFSVILGFFFIFVSHGISNETWYKEIIYKVGIGLIVTAILTNPILYLRKKFQQGIDKENARALEIYKIEQAGIVNLAMNWNEYKTNEGYGKYLRKHLNNFSKGSTWYIVTINPVGLMGDFLDEVIRPALRSGARLKWSYVKLPTSGGSAEDILVNWWDSQYALGRNQDRGTTIGLAQQNIGSNLQNLIRCLKEDITRNLYSTSDITLYESSIPTTFLSLLARKDAGDKLKGTGVAIVYPYVMFPSFEENHWGMLLEAGGKIYEQYSHSIMRYFDEGEKKGYLKRVWPQL